MNNLAYGNLAYKHEYDHEEYTQLNTTYDKWLDDWLISKKIIVNRALKRLKTDYRQVLWLFYFEDMSHKEISIIMRKSAHATQMLATRAREALKRELIKEGITDENF